MAYRWTKWTTWEYLPWWLANVPVYGFYLWFAVRARHIWFFSNVNPAIPLGGAMGESKSDILRLLPQSVLPKTVFAPAGISADELLEKMRQAGLDFPLIAKPDVGERGFLIKKLEDTEALRRHLERYPVDFILQEFLDLPEEYSVLFHRFPDGRFGITSVCHKEFLQVRGDGRSTVRALMAARPRAAFQLERFEREQPGLLDTVPEAGQTVLLEPIGNHARGTKFVNACYLADEAMNAAFEPLVRSLDGICYGRFDLKAASAEALQRGEVKVMELNGVLGEPAHVYDPAHGMWRAYRDFYRHWRLLFDLHRAQRRRGVAATPPLAGLRLMRQYFAYKNRLESR